MIRAVGLGGIFGQPLFPPGSGRVASCIDVLHTPFGPRESTCQVVEACQMSHVVEGAPMCFHQEMRCQGQPACAVLFKMTMQQECASISQRGVNGSFLKWGTVPPIHPC